MNSCATDTMHFFVIVFCCCCSRYCVSLRDVRRCIVLVKWFREILSNRSSLSNDDLGKLDEIALSCYEKARLIDANMRSVVLALAHSYQSRIPTSETRSKYRQKLSHIFRMYGKITMTEDVMSTIVRAEQEEYLARFVRLV